MFQTGFLTEVFRCVIGPVSPWWTVTNHTFAVGSSLVVTVGRVYMQMHGVQRGCSISETLCFDSNLVSQLMKNQLLAMSRIKPNICLLWFHNKFQLLPLKNWPWKWWFFPVKQQMGEPLPWLLHTEAVCSSTLPLSIFPAKYYSFWDMPSNQEVEGQVQKKLSWKIKWKVQFRYNDQGKRKCLAPISLPPSAPCESQELKPCS